MVATVMIALTIFLAGGLCGLTIGYWRMHTHLSENMESDWWSLICKRARHHGHLIMLNPYYFANKKKSA